MIMSVGKSLRAALWAVASAAAGQAHAQATRTWISGVGDDANPCSRTAPCKTFAGAISKTAAGGEIDVLDPGGFGAVTITKSITLAADGTGTAGILVSGFTGITINPATDPNATIYLRNLIIDGGPVAGNSQYGIRILGGDVHVDGCVIRGFGGTPGTPPTGGAGILMASSTVPTRLFVTNTKIYGNRIGVLNTATFPAPVALIDTVLDRNTDYGIQGSTVNSVFSLSRSVVTGSTVGISAPAPAKAVSYGNNLISSVEAGTTLTTAALR